MTKQTANTPIEQHGSTIPQLSPDYDFSAIESKWQAYWETHQTFLMPDVGDAGFDASKPKYYVMDMFPYPSGQGLHVGHPLGYIATDIVARYKRMQGYNVLHPMGFDSFGLPAEQYAVETGVHPRVTTEKNVDNMRRQLKRFGLSYDWSREVKTTDESFYKWTQWIFKQLYQSYFDETANMAKPISELITRFKTGDQPLTSDSNINNDDTDTRQWNDLTALEQDQLLDQYRLAYLADVSVNWCPKLGTVLANEEVTAEGRSERGNYPVHKRPLKQWMLRITAYADRLGNDLDTVDWPEAIKIMQRHWIGRSEGAHVRFQIDGYSDSLTVYTTRPDTLFGTTFMVMAPEHPIVQEIVSYRQKEAIDRYVANAAAKRDVDRQADQKEKTGVFTGAYAINPANGEKIPIWIADYVLMGYGTGVVMAVPAHDQRDLDFAIAFDLPVRAVIAPDGAWLTEHAPEVKDTDALRAAYIDEPKQFIQAYVSKSSQCIQSTSTQPGASGDPVSLDGMNFEAAFNAICNWLEANNAGKQTHQYKLRDWLFSRQRYWGEPFPIMHQKDGRLSVVDDADLPVVLPEMEDFKPKPLANENDTPEPSLGRADPAWVHPDPSDPALTRELNTMPQWAGSCWYYLRYISPHDSQRFVSKESEAYWMGENGVDLYVGGAEHAVLHLLYARFWHKVLYDLGHVTTPEPFGRLFNQGYIQAYAYQDDRGFYLPADEIEEKEGQYLHDGKPAKRLYGKMGKSLKNAVNPDDMFDTYGCDTLRLYEMYLGPLESSKPWNTRDIIGVHRFLKRMYRNFVTADGALLVTPDPPSDAEKKLLHQTISKVTDSIDNLRFNTALAFLIELNNDLVKRDTLAKETAEGFLTMLAPFAPHLCEALWEAIGHTTSIALASWPTFDESLLKEDTTTVVIQVGGKTRGKLTVAVGSTQADIEALVKDNPDIAKFLEDKTIRKIIHIPNRLLNYVV